MRSRDDLLEVGDNYRCHCSGLLGGHLSHTFSVIYRPIVAVFFTIVAVFIATVAVFSVAVAVFFTTVAVKSGTQAVLVVMEKIIYSFEKIISGLEKVVFASMQIKSGPKIVFFAPDTIISARKEDQFTAEDNHLAQDENDRYIKPCSIESGSALGMPAL